jgi:hypothetical protein
MVAKVKFMVSIAGSEWWGGGRESPDFAWIFAYYVISARG